MSQSDQRTKIAKLRRELLKLSKKELIQKCRKQNISSNGTKTELANRLMKPLEMKLQKKVESIKKKKRERREQRKKQQQLAEPPTTKDGQYKWIISYFARQYNIICPSNLQDIIAEYIHIKCSFHGKYYGGISKNAHQFTQTTSYLLNIHKTDKTDKYKLKKSVNKTDNFEGWYSEDGDSHSIESNGKVIYKSNEKHFVLIEEYNSGIVWEQPLMNHKHRSGLNPTNIKWKVKFSDDFSSCIIYRTQERIALKKSLWSVLQ